MGVVDAHEPWLRSTGRSCLATEGGHTLRHTEESKRPAPSVPFCSNVRAACERSRTRPQAPRSWRSPCPFRAIQLRNEVAICEDPTLLASVAGARPSLDSRRRPKPNAPPPQTRIRWSGTIRVNRARLLTCARRASRPYPRGRPGVRAALRASLVKHERRDRVHDVPLRATRDDPRAASSGTGLPAYEPGFPALDAGPPTRIGTDAIGRGTIRRYGDTSSNRH
jgi:hypothetical protein